MRKKELLEKIIDLENQHLRVVSYLDYIANEYNKNLDELHKQLQNFQTTDRKIENKIDTYLEHDPSYRKYVNKKEFFEDNDF